MDGQPGAGGGPEENSGGKPPREERYDWPSVALFVIFLAAFLYALRTR